MLDATAADRLVATVNEDLFCIGCEYNLRTQPLDAACPECGRSVRETLDFPRLARSAPRWLTSLVDSVTVMIISFVADMLILRIRVRNEWLAMALATIPWSLTWFAIWLLTRPEPGSAGRARRADRARAWAMRGLATCPYLTFILAMQPSFVQAGWFGEIGEVVLVGLLLCAAPAGFLYYDHLRRAAVRLPAPRLTSQARLLRWLVPGAAALSIGYLVFGRFRGSAGDLLHFLPRPAMPGSADVSLLLDLLLAGLDPTRPSILTRVFSALATLAAMAVLVQFRVAFARAVRASKQPRRM